MQLLSTVVLNVRKMPSSRLSLLRLRHYTNRTTREDQTWDPLPRSMVIRGVVRLETNARGHSRSHPPLPEILRKAIVASKETPPLLHDCDKLEYSDTKFDENW